MASDSGEGISEAASLKDFGVGDFLKLVPSKSFEVDGDKIDVIGEPGDFYQALLDGIQGATRQITVASLYLVCWSPCCM